MDKKVKNYFKKQKLTAASSRISHYTYWRYATRAACAHAHARTHAHTSKIIITKLLLVRLPVREVKNEKINMVYDSGSTLFR